MNKIFWPWFKYLDYLHTKYLKKYPYPMRHSEQYNKDVVKLSLLYAVPVMIVAGGFFISSLVFNYVISSAIVYCIFTFIHVAAIVKYERNNQ